MSETGATLLTATVEEEHIGLRLDKWLAQAFPVLSRTRIKALIEEGHVNAGAGTLTDASARVKPGQTLRIVVPDSTPAEPHPQDIALTVVYEDEHLIVIDKPAGMVVHPAPGNPDTTLVNALLHHCASTLSGIGGVKRPGIVHRLDKDTSGLMVAAKSDAAHQGLAEQFADHSITRAYWALVWGVPRPASGEITGNIGRNPNDRKKMAIVNHGGKHALTRYRVLNAFGTAAALVECRLATGRTHQIRVHMTAQGHPLVGDKTYGHAPRRDRLRHFPQAAGDALVQFERQALHAFLIGFAHPITAERLSFESMMPSDINELIDILESA